MTKNNIGMSGLISHRFRGFAPYENTLEGLRSALDFGVLNLEFDVRMAACGTPIIYHDEYARDSKGCKRLLSDYKASSYDGLGGDFTRMPSLDDLLCTVKAHQNTSARLLIDIKDYGFEHEIHALVMIHRLANRTIYVSWQPDVLYALHTIAPNIPLCFSHWSMAVTKQIMTNHRVFNAKNGVITKTNQSYIIGVRSGWSVQSPLSGDMLAILQKSGGGVCVPQVMLTRDLSNYYHNKGLFVSTFSYTDWDTINAHKFSLNVDLYFVDNKHVFQNLC